MARKWHPFFGKVQSFLNRVWKFILISIFATITILNIQGVLPVLAHQAGAETGEHLNLFKRPNPPAPFPSREGGERDLDRFLGKIEMLPETVLQTQNSRAHLSLDNLPSSPPTLLPISNGENLLEEGTRFYEKLRFAEAEVAWQSAVGLLSGEEKALGLNYIALAQLRQSKLDEAEISIQESSRLLNPVMTRGNSERKQTIQARILTTAAQVNLARNQPKLTAHALKQLAESTAIYQQLNQENWVIASQINQAQAMQQLGMYREALKTLKDLEDRIFKSEPAIQLSGILNLGKTYRAIGVLDQSYCVLKQAGEGNPEIDLELANTDLAIGNRLKDQLDSITDETSDPISTTEQTQKCQGSVELGTSVNAWFFYKKARDLYQKVSNSPEVKAETQVQAMVNDLRLAVDLKDTKGLEVETREFETEARELAPQVLPVIEILPLNRERVYDRLHLARSLAQLNRELSQQQLEIALAEAQELQDKRAQAYGMGELGWMKQQQGNLTEAEQWTREAVAMTPPDATDMMYQWEWQLGQILKEEGRTEEAIWHYTQAVDLLQRVRQNLVAIAAGFGEMNADLQFDFRDRVEPVYRELVGLLLDTQGNEVTSQDNLQTALGVIELLQVAELENFLQCDLQPEPKVQLARSVAEAKQKVAEKLTAIYQNKPDYAVIYPIIIQDKLEVILGLPGTPLVHFSTHSSDNIKNILANFRGELIIPRDFEAVKNQSFKLYEMLITPVESEIDNKSILFIVDIPLQSLPMSALYNKITKKYLIQTHTIQMTSSLQLLQIDAEKHPITEVLIAGIAAEQRTERNIVFNSLDYVEQELDDIRKHFPASQKLFKEEFTQINLEQAISHQTFPAIHLATHGHFSSQRYLTFLLDGQTIIEVADFKRLFAEPSYLTTNPIQLLVLSACQTAQGDRKSALGIAGLTVNGQINNTIASLWSVNDQSTARLMNKFYEKLMEFSSLDVSQSDRTALALQEAQKFMIEDPESIGRRRHHPSSWSPFILLSNAL